jgi:TonB family protein
MKSHSLLLPAALFFFMRANDSIAIPAQDSMISIDALTKAAGQGVIESQVQLAVQWFLKAADQGNAAAQYYAGDFYRNGIGVKQDYVQAYKWSSLAASVEKGQQAEAAKLCAAVASQMTIQQLTQARQLAWDWKKTHSISPFNSELASYGRNPYTIGGDIKSPVPIVQLAPPYTAEARKAGIEGTVHLQCFVRKDGTTDSFRILRALGYGLDESAINTIFTQWRYQPGTLKGNPVDVLMDISVSFKLAQQSSTDK